MTAGRVSALSLDLRIRLALRQGPDQPEGRSPAERVGDDRADRCGEQHPLSTPPKTSATAELRRPGATSVAATCSATPSVTASVPAATRRPTSSTGNDGAKTITTCAATTIVSNVTISRRGDRSPTATETGSAASATPAA